MSAQGSCSIYKVDTRICRYDNGTDICDKGHKLTVSGTCFSQSIGTFLSTDAAFQPTYLICSSDYDALNSSQVNEFVYEDISGSYKVFGYDDVTVASGTEVSYGGVDSSTFSVGWSTNWLQSYDKIETISGTCWGHVPEVVLSSGISVDWIELQFDSGYVSRGLETYSGFFSYDVFGQVTMVTSFLVPKEPELYYILKVGTKSATINTVSSSEIGTTSNPSYDDNEALNDNPLTICVGDEISPTISGVSPTDGSILLDRSFPVSFVVYDTAGGVDIDSVYLSVSGTVTTSGSPYVIEAGVVTVTGAQIIGSSSLYSISYTPETPWQENEQVVVTVTGTDRIPTVSGEPFTCTDLLPNGFWESWEYKVANTSDLGVSITVLADESAPYITNSTPVQFSGNNSSDEDIIFDIIDDLTGVNGTTVDVKVNDTYVVQDGVALYSNVSLASVTGGYRFTYTTSTGFSYGDRVFIEVYAEDSYTASPNVLSITWYYDIINTSSITIENFLPGTGLTRNPGNTSIEVDIYDSTYSLSRADSYLSLNGYSVDTTKSDLYGNRDLTTVSGIDYLSGVTVSGATAAQVGISCTNIVGDNISGGTLGSAYFTGGLLYDFPAPYDNTTSGTIVTASGYNGDVVSGHLETTLVSGVNWDGKYTCSTINNVSLTDFNIDNVDSYNTIINSIIGFHLEHSSNTWFTDDSSVGVHTTNLNSVAPVSLSRYYNVYHGYNVKVFGNSFDRNSPVEVFYGAENKKRFRNNYYDSYYFYTRDWEKEDLTASIVGVLKQGDITASITSVTPSHYYGAVINVQIRANDVDGNELTYNFSYTIEDAP